ncbi:polyketide cyclase [Ornithinimicrobium tianjinense]|uniref:Polyketide cyclase n=2 Tax=Ornithinimicrobium tianjinense TaxID=1195761 RepID=A0A917EZY9_9MICO|nr:polyketide cyclase [Ornithinimicrobium tianjinense]
MAMVASDELTFSDSIVVDAPPAAVYAVVSDVTRTGEWSPVCRRAEWEDPARTGEGARFLGHNDDGTREWTTTSTVVAARPGEEFTWEVGQSYVRWSYLMRPAEDGSGTVLTHAWEVLPALHGMYADKYGDEAAAVLARRTESAHASIPSTLAVIKEIVERDAG